MDTPAVIKLIEDDWAARNRPDVEKWKKAMMKDNLDFVNDIRNLIPDMTNFERDVTQLYEDLMTAREKITIPPPLPAEDIEVDEGLAEADIKDELQDPLPDIKEEVIQQEEKETLPTLPAEPKFVEFKEEPEEPEEDETSLEALTRQVSRQSEDITALLEGDERRQAEERNAELDRLTQQSKADLEEALALLGEKYEPPKVVKRAPNNSGVNVLEEDWAKGTFFMEMEARKDKALQRALEVNRANQAQREKDLRELAKSIVSLQKRRKGTADKEQELLQLQRQQEFDKQQEEEMILLQKGILSKADRDLARALDRMYNDVSLRLDELDDRLAKKQNAVLAVKVGKARKKEEKELRQLEEDKQKEEQKLLDVVKRREAILKRVVPLEQSPVGEVETKNIRIRRPTVFSPLEEAQMEVGVVPKNIEIKSNTLEGQIRLLEKKVAPLNARWIELGVRDMSRADLKALEETDPATRKEISNLTKQRQVIDFKIRDLRNELETKQRQEKEDASKKIRNDLEALPATNYEEATLKIQAIDKYLETLPEDDRNRASLEDILSRTLTRRDLKEKLDKSKADTEMKKTALSKLDKAWVDLGKSLTNLELVEFKEVLNDRFRASEWDNEIEDFIQAEKDEQARESLGMPRLYIKKQELVDDIRGSQELTDLVQRQSIAVLDSLTEPQFKLFIETMGSNSLEEKARKLAERPANLPTPPTRRPTPVRPRLSSRQPSMEAIVEGEEPVNPLIVEKEQLTEQELNDQLEALKRKRPRKDIDKMTKKTEMDAILDVLGRKAFKPDTPIDVLEQRFKTEGTAPKRPLPVPRPARTPEQRRQAAEESKASEPRVSTPLKRAPTPSTRLDTPTKARVPIKTTFEKRIDQPVAELVKQAEAVLPELEKLSRKRPTPVRARPAEEREGDREMADALRRAEKREEERVFKVQPDDITLKAQKEAELFLAENLRRAGVSREDVVAVKTLVEQKKKDEGFQGTIAKKKAMKSPYSSPENVTKFQEVQARLEPPPRVETLLATRVSRVSDAQERLRLEGEERKMRLERELEAQKLKPNEEAKRLIEERREERRSTTPSSRPETPLRTKTPVQRLIQARALVRDFEAMKAELDAGVSDKDAVYQEERERYKNGTKTLNLWNSMNLTPEEQQLLGTSKDEFLGKWAEAVRKAGKGIPMKPKTFIEFGKFKLNENMLEEGVLQVKTANGSPVPAFSKKVAISDTLQTILMDLIETKKLRGVSDLDDEERRMLETLIIKAGLAHGLGVKKVHQSDEDAKKVKRFDLVKGIYEAGNNSVEVIHELRSLILYFIKTKRLNRKEGIEALQELQ
jgi:hypothetical protein